MANITIAALSSWLARFVGILLMRISLRGQADPLKLEIYELLQILEVLDSHWIRRLHVNGDPAFWFVDLQ